MRPIGRPPGVYTTAHPQLAPASGRPDTQEQPRSTYLFTFRAPVDYAPSADTFQAWAAWQLRLGVRLKDRGNPAFASAVIGRGAADTTLGGYGDHDDKFDEWLGKHLMTETPPVEVVEVTVRIAAAPEAVFGYLTDPARHVRWMGSEATLEPVPGGRYHVRMGDGFSAAGTFLQVEPPHRLAFSWGFADDESAQHVKHVRTEESSGSAMPAGSTRVMVRLDAEDDGTRLTLHHHDLPNTELREAHRLAWQTYLPRLVIRAEGGDPGTDPHA